VRILFLFLAKELRDIWRNKQVLPAYFLLPVIAVGISVLFTLILPGIVQAKKKDPGMDIIVRIVQTLPDFAGMPLQEGITRYFLRNLAGFFLLMPVALSSFAAAFSIVGEKQQRTLEPILATPITDRQFLMAKLVASITPAIALTWLAGLAAAVMVDFISWERYGYLLLPDRFWLVGLLALAPVMGIASVLATMHFSARMTDPQAANQFTGLVIIPIFLLIVGLFGRTLTLSFVFLWSACLVVLLLDVVLFRFILRKFQREEILTRWK
jgi:ABC-2 type transport system permease protein